MKQSKDELTECTKGIRDSILHWKLLNQNGSNDPFWTDGTNMNLVRNHILWYKGRIIDYCEVHQIHLPEEYYIPTPPEVDKGYMANLKQESRVKRLLQMGDRLSLKKAKYDYNQMSFM